VIGEKLAHYTITGKLGEGGMGVVYEALDGHLDRSVALKLLPHETVANPARKQRFVQEAKAASGLNHPNIVTIYDIAAVDQIDYIAMELVRGRTLEQLLSRGKLRVADALKYGLQIADALAAAHAAGIVHRDVKPSNIMINERGNIKVLDFGLAKLTDPGEVSGDDETRTQRAITEEGTVVGSAPYMSPEQAEGHKVDSRSDIFSYGSVFYEMLTGKRAFAGANRTATVAAILKDEPPPVSRLVPDVPNQLERILSRCLRKEIERRSQSMAEIRIELQELKEESESGAPTPAIVKTTAKRSRRLYFLLGAPILCIVIVTAVYLRPWHPAAELEASVLTSFVGLHGEPSLSPDGNQFAFAWDGDVPRGKQHVYISLVGKGTPLRLSSDNAFEPVWSPDGQSIAYVRETGKSTEFELAVVPALGGPAHQVSSPGQVFSPAWSPDSKYLAWAQQDTTGISSLYIASAGGGEPHQLVRPAAATRGDSSPAFSPDGRRIVFDRTVAAWDSDFYLLDFRDEQATGPPRQLTRDHRPKRNPVWTGEGKQILFIADESTNETSINRLTVANGQSARIPGIGANAQSLTYSAKANRLLYDTEAVNYDIWRIDMTAKDAKPERFLSSTRYESSPAYSPDGKRIAFESNRGGIQQIWVADLNGANPMALTSFGSGVAGSSKWSPDGRFIVFDARPGTGSDIYTVPASGGPVKQLTSYPGEDALPFWSPDGNWIYFASTRAGGNEIFRIHPNGGDAQQITHGGGMAGQVTADGKWLFYTVSHKGLWKMPTDGGTPTQVLPKEALYKRLSFTLGPGGIFAAGHKTIALKTDAGLADADEFPIVFYPFNGGKSRTIITATMPIENIPGVSPDGRYLLYSMPDAPVDEIMLVDNFH
jgi:Tol biopolymer transport system component/tRNA A-37 threonylcarbamoyl transferase component Bud32